MKITIATVTYGKRTHYLTRMLDAAKAQGACQAVVIDNGSADPISTILSERYGNWVHVHVLGRNSGSALGYKTAMEQALAHNAELILLLDDDNVLAGNCLIRLLNKWQNYAACGVATNDFAVHAVRLRQGGDPTCGVRFQQPQRNSFLGFHIAEMPYKFVRRLAPGLLKRGDDQADIAPYGGMMFHRDLLMRVGLPDEKYFLYADDYDFTNRVAKIYFVADALVHDVDNRVGQQSRLFTARLNTADFSKLYYSVRNLAYFESYFWNQNQLVYSVNRLLFMAVLTGLALSKNRFLRYKIILQAIRDGKNASLGANPAYQI